MKRILITGAKGFIGKNLVIELKNRGYDDILEYDVDSDPALLDKFCQTAQFVFHLAGVNRPQKEVEFMEGNFGFTSELLKKLRNHNNNAPIMLSSSTQATLENPYGKSKKAGENVLRDYGNDTGAKILIYRFPNVFGKWCKPNYNSAVATFCHNIAHDIPITINDPEILMNLVYIDDVVKELIDALEGDENQKNTFCEVPIVHSIKLGEIVKLITSFKQSREDISLPNMSNPFTKKLYSTYLSYLPPHLFRYPLKMNIDERGSFTEFIKTPDRGQVSINISKPGVVKGNHWHHTKNEKFLVVSGEGIIRFRKIGDDDILEYPVSDKKMEVIDIPVGYTHNIENTGNTDMVTVMWASEPFNREKPDTYYMEV